MRDYVLVMEGCAMGLMWDRVFSADYVGAALCFIAALVLYGVVYRMRPS